MIKVPKVYQYAAAAIVLVAVLGGLWLHGYRHGIAVEHTRQLEAIEQLRLEDAREIERLRKENQKRRKVVTRIVKEIQNVPDPSACQCLDAELPDPVAGWLRDAFDQSVRSAPHGALSVCRVPLACDRPHSFDRAGGTMGADEGV